jgi:hypothetical protein
VKTQKHEVEERGIRVHLRFEPACSSYYRTTPASVNVSNVHQRQRQAARENEHQSALPVQHLVESKQDELIPITIELNMQRPSSSKPKNVGLHAKDRLRLRNTHGNRTP